MSLELLTHAVRYAPDRIEGSRFLEQTRAMQPVPRQISLRTVMILVTLFCGAAATVGGMLRASPQQPHATTSSR